MGADGYGPFESDDAADWLASVSDGETTVRATLERFVAKGAAGEHLEQPDSDAALAAAAVVAAALDASCDDLAGPGMAVVGEVADADAEDIAEFKRLAQGAVPMIARSQSAEGWDDDAAWWTVLRRIAAAVGAELDGVPSPTPELDEAVQRARLEVVAAAGAGSRPDFERVAAVYVHTLLRRASATDPAKTAPPLDAFIEEFEGSDVTDQLWEAAQGNAAASLIVMLSMLEQQL